MSGGHARAFDAKRAFDVIATLVSLPLVLPVAAVVAIAVRRSMGSPVLFAQERPGLGGRPFRMFKFRTMREAYDASGAPLPDSERVTRVGQAIRATSLDELPELFNVLRGEMSLVGPRPLLMRYLPRYSPRQQRRHEARPGITGWAQVNGRNAISWEQKFELDVWYVEHRSMWLDLRILAMTIGKIVKREGISQDGHVTSDEFRGSHG